MKGKNRGRLQSLGEQLKGAPSAPRRRCMLVRSNCLGHCDLMPHIPFLQAAVRLQWAAAAAAASRRGLLLLLPQLAQLRLQRRQLLLHRTRMACGGRRVGAQGCHQAWGWRFPINVCDVSAAAAARHRCDRQPPAAGTSSLHGHCGALHSTAHPAALLHPPRPPAAHRPGSSLGTTSPSGGSSPECSVPAACANQQRHTAW